MIPPDPAKRGRGGEGKEGREKEGTEEGGRRGGRGRRGNCAVVNFPLKTLVGLTHNWDGTVCGFRACFIVVPHVIF